MRNCFRIGSFFLAILLLPGARTVRADEIHALPLVVVSLPPQAEIVKRLAGAFIQLQVMLPAGTNHEAYEPTIGQLTALSRAALYVKLGHPKFLFESRSLDKILSSTPQLKVVDAAKDIEVDPDDLHYWTSPRRLRGTVPVIAAALTELLPEKKPDIESNAKSVTRELEQLDHELTEKFAPFPGAAFLVFHPSWGYFARDYGLKQLVIEQEGKEPGIGQSQRILREARTLHLTTVFTEPGSPHESVKYLTESLSAHEVVLDPVAADWIENLRLVADKFVRSFQEAKLP